LHVDPPALPMALQEAIASFRRWVDDDYLHGEQRASRINRPLYHYTDARGLKGIIESGAIWFTDYRHMNDPSELVHGIELAHLIADDPDLNADQRVEAFLKTFIDMFEHARFQATLDFFIASFSRSRDELGQWRAYADNGRGFAIGFSPRIFSITKKPPDDKPPEFVGPVRYAGQRVLESFRAPIEKAANIFLITLAAHPEMQQEVRSLFTQELSKELIASPMIWRCLTVKHPAYEHEREVRLLIVGTPGALRPHVTTRFRGSEIVPYIPQPMAVREKDIIVEIVVGPAAPPDTERTLRTMLTSLNVVVDNILRSEIPYRAV
jgi:Protein of unknown function (DUF2971)